MMDLPTTYSVTVLVVSVAATLIFAWNLTRAVRWYRRRPAEAWASALISLVLVVIGIGLTVSALGAVATDPAWAIAGLSLARGALFTGAVVLLVADRHQRHE